MEASDSELEELLRDVDSPRVERAVSFEKGDIFREAICAFANDLPGTGKPGYLFVGATDDGRPAGMPIDDQLLLPLTSIRAEGTILPQPRINVEKRLLLGGSVAVIEVFPSDMPPVRYKGSVRVRIGPRKDVASEAEERVLAERRAAVMARTWDARPAVEATLDDLALDLFTLGYRGSAVSAAVIAENHRSLEQQLSALRLFDSRAARPTNAAVVLFAKDPLFFSPGAYVQYVRYDGQSQTRPVTRQRNIEGDLVTVLRDLDSLAEDVALDRPLQDGLADKMVSDYPKRALHELFVNAVVHRNFESTTPVMISHFDDRLEILNPGGLYGDLTAEQFPHGTAYRNPVLAEACRVLGFANRFGRGIDLVQDLLATNGSRAARFDPRATFFLAVVERRP